MVANKDGEHAHHTSDKHLERLSDTHLNNWKMLVLLVKLSTNLRMDQFNMLEKLLPRKEQLTWIELLPKLSRKRRRRLKRNECCL